MKLWALILLCSSFILSAERHKKPDCLDITFTLSEGIDPNSRAAFDEIAWYLKTSNKATNDDWLTLFNHPVLSGIFEAVKKKFNLDEHSWSDVKQDTLRRFIGAKINEKSERYMAQLIQTIAENLCKNRIRNDKKYLSLSRYNVEEEYDCVELDRAAENNFSREQTGEQAKDNLELLELAMKGLSERQQTAIRLIAIEGLSYEEAVIRMQEKTTKAFKSLLSRARAALKKSYLELGGNPYYFEER